MVSRTYTVAFEGVEARPVEVQCAVTPGLPAFSIVGLYLLKISVIYPHYQLVKP